MTTGDLDEARKLVRQSVETRPDGELSTQTLTFSLVAHARLVLARGDPRSAALALGAASALRQRVGLRTWPSMRRSEADLLAGVKGKLGPEMMEQVLAEGSRIDRDAAIALVRGSG